MIVGKSLSIAKSDSEQNSSNPSGSENKSHNGREIARDSTNEDNSASLDFEEESSKDKAPDFEDESPNGIEIAVMSTIKKYDR